ncbi:MAG: hypothetical protein A2149_07570 [Candidatus Schekmanbacteria bacterium RBG_16_38_11]|uniref:Uncharacterized protein n=1 Tax=Candidatus Schekmanbacteria bacterium RBG_16_38_11 TaxID=1817880 RepID=A0A1F7RXD3_9BACT|nr:MAG: hypothetical protein A2149_07570 [Candidatus Schekmanbacteria bacterium RBG_16_38_11]
MIKGDFFITKPIKKKIKKCKVKRFIERAKSRKRQDRKIQEYHSVRVSKKKTLKMSGYDLPLRANAK